MNDEILEVPKATCPGCDGRDLIIRSLVNEIDRRDGIEVEHLEPADAQAEYDRRVAEREQL